MTQLETHLGQNILIVKLSSLGDVIHTLPAAQALRRRFPEAHIAWAVERDHADMLHGQPFLDEVIEWNRGTWCGLWAFLHSLRHRRWDLAVDFQGLLRSALVMRASGARQRLGFAPGRERSHWLYNRCVPLPATPLHAVDKSLQLVESLGATLPGLPIARAYLNEHHGRPTSNEFSQAFPLPHSAEAVADVDAWLARHRFAPASRQLVILNPHCRKEANIWPAERYSALAARLLEHDDLRVVLTGGPIARQLCDQIAEPLGSRVWRADGEFSLAGSTELIRRASLFVTGDTGPMHIAAAVGTPIVALFGPADPLRTGPYTNNAVVLTKRLPCSPCFARQCPLGHAQPPCLSDIVVDEAYAAAMTLLERRKQPSTWRLSA